MRWAALCLLAALLGGCAGAPVPRATPDQPAPRDDSDEAGLILQMQRFEEELANSPLRVRDPALNAYLRELTCKLAGDYCGDIRVYLLRQPYFNAAMAPNGMLVIWTGLLLRVEDEAQLAAVIGHEVGHYVARDSLARWRRMKAAGNLTVAFQVLGGSIAGAAVGLGAYSGLYAFSRDQERAADQYGIERMRALGYDDRRVGDLWAAIWDEESQRDRDLMSAIFASHPASTERRDRLRRAAQSQGGETGVERYHAVVEPLRADWLEDEIGRRHYSQTEVLLARLARLPYDQAELAYYQAEMYRRRARPADLALAHAAYQRATAAPGAPAGAWRGLGLVLQKLGRSEDARAAFAEYLKRAPDAGDRAMIESWLQ
ncbi:MAG: M48 family metallopeptidase [Lysobacterales bacterium]